MVKNDRIDSFYNNLYFIALKALLIDNTNWKKVDIHYSIKATVNEGKEGDYPEISIMIINNKDLNVYEHYFVISKVNDINGIISLSTIIKECSLKEKVKYIIDSSLDMNGELYRMKYLPIHLKPVTEELISKVKNMYDIEMLQTAEKIKNLSKANQQKSLIK